MDRIVETVSVAVVVTVCLVIWRIAARRAPEPPKPRTLTPERLGLLCLESLKEHEWFAISVVQGQVHVYKARQGYRVMAGAWNRHASCATDAAELVTEWYAEALGGVGPRRARMQEVFRGRDGL